MCSIFYKEQFTRNLLNKIYQISASRLLSAVSSSEINAPIEIKGRKASSEQKRIVTEYVTKIDSIKVDWNALKKSVLSINRGYINERNINGFIMDTCSREKRLDLVNSYIKYLKECDHTKLNTTLELIYIRTCYTSRDQLTDDDRYEIQIICNKQIKNNIHLMNSTFLECIVMGLCCTPLWRDSLNYLKTLPNENDITSNTFIYIIIRAFEDAEVDLGWTLTQQLFNRHNILPLVIFATWFNLCETNKNYTCLRALEFLRDNECVLNEDMAKLIQEKLQKFDNKITTTTIYHKSGKCKMCNQVLNPIEITDSEFKLLQERFMSDVVVRKNIFNNSSPQELQNFKDFLEVTGPYDVVIDGLNVAYAFQGKINSLTKTIMKNYIERKLKVLLIGRGHLAKMLGRDFNYIKENVDIFFTNDLSKDDPFVLYATMYSGLGTKILTKDLMRSHKVLLDDTKLRNIFQKWLQKHRLVLKSCGQNRFIINDPINYLQTSQESKDGVWHLPYQENKEPGTWSKPDSSPDNWLCIKLKV